MLKNKLSKIIAGSLVLISTIILCPMSAEAQGYYSKKYSSPDKHGWVHDDLYYSCAGYNIQSWNYYDENGNPEEGWFMVDGKWYYGDQMHEDEHCGIYMNEWAPEYSGENEKGYYRGPIDYYCGSDGAAMTGWFQTYKQSDYKHKEGLKWFYADSNGKIYRNSYTPDGYCVDADGVWS